MESALCDGNTELVDMKTNVGDDGNPCILKWSCKTSYLTHRNKSQRSSPCTAAQIQNTIFSKWKQGPFGIKASNGFWITRSCCQFLAKPNRHANTCVQKIFNTAQTIIVTLHLIWALHPPTSPLVQTITALRNSPDEWLDGVWPVVLNDNSSSILCWWWCDVFSISGPPRSVVHPMRKKLTIEQQTAKGV